MRFAIPTLVVAVAAAAPSARAAESYDSCTGTIASLPATISTQGTWCLQNDLATSISSGNAITITTNNVTIDCNGFKLGGLGGGTSSTARGIYAYNRSNLTVRGCNIRGFNRGLYFEGMDGAGHLVENNRFDGNLAAGIVVDGDGSLIRSNQVSDTGGLVNSMSSVGIMANGGDILDNLVTGVFATDPVQRYPVGISTAGQGTTIARNTVRYIVAPVGAAYGIYASGPAQVIRENTVATYPADSGNAAGRGILAGGPDFYTSFCFDNAVAGWATPYAYCVSTTGNQSK